jgi:cholesterol transport system auxiliary component
MPGTTPGATLTLIISPPLAASGFDSQRIVYLRDAHHLEYFAHSEWVDPPARMLGPLLVSAAQQTGAFAAVVLASGTAAGDLRLSTDILQLQHNFQSQPSRVQLTLRAYLTDEKTRRVLAWQEFHAEVPAASDTPQGGVAAANRVVQEVLTQVAQFLVTRPK